MCVYIYIYTHVHLIQNINLRRLLPLFLEEGRVAAVLRGGGELGGRSKGRSSGVGVGVRVMSESKGQSKRSKGKRKGKGKVQLTQFLSPCTQHLHSTNHTNTYHGSCRGYLLVGACARQCMSGSI